MASLFPMFHPPPTGMKEQRDGCFGMSLLEAPSPVLVVTLFELLEMPVGQRSPDIWGLL